MWRPPFKNLPSRGFTLVEMITVVAIIVVMTGVVLANFPDFRDRASLELVAQELSLVIRQAQSFGSQTRAVLSASETQFPSYGVFFNTNDSGLQQPQSATSFILFADRKSDTGVADYHYSDVTTIGCGTPAKECREVFNLQGGLKFEDTADSSGLALCPASGACMAQNHLNIVFDRPNPEAHFRSSVDSGASDLTCGDGIPCTYAKITLKSQRNNQTRDICVWTTGHIYTKPTCL